MADDLFTKLWADVRRRRPQVVMLNAVYKFVVDGPRGGTWLLDCTGGSGGVITKGDGPADCTFTVDEAGLIGYFELTDGRREMKESGRLKSEGTREHKTAFRLAVRGQHWKRDIDKVRHVDGK